MIVKDLIDCLNCIEDKYRPVYVSDITTGQRYLDIDSVEINSDIKLIIET